MTKATAQLIDATYDAIELMSIFAQRLSEGEISDTEAGSMSWLLGSAKKRLEPVINALEEAENQQRHLDPRENDDLVELGAEILALHARFQRRRGGLKEVSND